MLNSRSDNLNLIKLLGIILLVAAIVVFAIFRSINYLKGPSVEILSPANGSTIETRVVELTGKAERINKIFLNGHPISIDEHGNWKETIIIFQGLNLITIRAEDQFGRIVSKQLDIVGKTNQ